MSRSLEQMKAASKWGLVGIIFIAIIGVWMTTPNYHQKDDNRKKLFDQKCLSRFTPAQCDFFEHGADAQ